MIDRTQLTEAPSEYEWALLDKWLERYVATARDYEARLVRLIIEQYKQMRRLLLDFPTDQQVKAGAVELDRIWNSSETDEWDIEQHIASVLEAVRDTMIGDG